MSNPKILHIGLCVYRDKESSITKAFKGATDNYLELSLSEKHLQQRSIQLAEAFRPDLVFLQIQADNILHLDTVKEIKKHSRTVINWTGDVRSPLQPFFLPMAKEIDYTCFTNMRDVNFIRSKGYGAEFVQIGYDETIYYPNVSRGTDIDIVFMGNNYGNQFPLGKQRIEMVNFLRNAYGNRFKVFGNFHRADGNVNHSQEEEAAIYRRAKISINFSHFNLERYTSDRMLRLMGSGTLCLTHKFEGIEQDFKDGENVVVWETFEGLKSKIDYYLANENERERVAANGEKLVRNRNTFDCMVKELIKLIK